MYSKFLKFALGASALTLVHVKLFPNRKVITTFILI